MAACWTIRGCEGPENNYGALPGDVVEEDPYEAMSEEERVIVKKKSEKKRLVKKIKRDHLRYLLLPSF